MSVKPSVVVGMTCAQCVLSVREAIRDAAVRATVAEAGFEVAT